MVDLGVFLEKIKLLLLVFVLHVEAEKKNVYFSRMHCVGCFLPDLVRRSTAVLIF